MRTWRVGTISMGLTLILLGIFLVLSQLLNWKPAYAMMSWWPIILIVLGLEILIYLFLSKQDSPIVKYDLFSIFFVIVIGIVGIGFTAISSTGILDKIYEWANYEIKTIDLPEYSVELEDNIERIVVHTGPDPLTIETGITNEVAVFGTYVTETINEKTLIKSSNDYLFTEQKGDTLFVTFKAPPQTFSPFAYHSERNATMIVPNDVQVEVEANHQSLSVNTRNLLNDWTISNAMEVNVKLESDLDVMLNAENVEYIQNQDDNWKLAEQNNEDDTYQQHAQSGTFQLGKGTYIINILDTPEISVVTQ